MRSPGIPDGYGKGNERKQTCFLNVIEKVHIRVRLGMNPERVNRGVGETQLESIVRAIDPNAREIGLQCRRTCRVIKIFSHIVYESILALTLANLTDPSCTRTEQKSVAFIKLSRGIESNGQLNGPKPPRTGKRGLFSQYTKISCFINLTLFPITSLLPASSVRSSLLLFLGLLDKNIISLVTTSLGAPLPKQGNKVRRYLGSYSYLPIFSIFLPEE